MISFAASARDFELYPCTGAAFAHLDPLIRRLGKIEFTLSAANPTVNQGQLTSNFDSVFEQALVTVGASHHHLPLPPTIPQELDFAFAYDGWTVAVEIEKSNREKILRDILKCHMYLDAGADFALIGLPRNYPHKLGVWNLFDFGVSRLRECLTHGFGTPEKLGRIVLLGFSQHDATDGSLFSSQSRQLMRQKTMSPDKP
jgi:hypothetical protein